MNNRVLVTLAALLFSLPSLADTLTDAQNLNTIYKGAFEIDHANPASVRIETFTSNQEVQLRISTKALGTAAARLLGFHSTGGGLRACGPGKTDLCPTPEFAPVVFSNLRVFLDGCDRTAQIVSLCSTASCLGVGVTVPTTLGGILEFTSTVALNGVVATGCAPGTFTGFSDDSKHLIEFRETSSVGELSGGRLEYEVLISNKKGAVRQ